jgi:hypothetical protein
MASTDVTRRAADEWIAKLRELTGSTFPAPGAPLTGDELERTVDDALDALYGPEWADGWEDVAVALRALHSGARFPLMLPAFAPGTKPPARPGTTRRAKRAEIAAYGATLEMCVAAREHAEVLARLFPGRAFTPAVEPVPRGAHAERDRPS